MLPCLLNSILLSYCEIICMYQTGIETFHPLWMVASSTQQPQHSISFALTSASSPVPRRCRRRGGEGGGSTLVPPSLSSPQSNYLLQSYPFISPAAPSIVREDVSLPPPFLGRQASLTKGNFATVSPYYKMQYRVIDVV